MRENFCGDCLAAPGRAAKEQHGTGPQSMAAQQISPAKLLHQPDKCTNIMSRKYQFRSRPLRLDDLNQMGEAVVASKLQGDQRQPGLYSSDRFAPGGPHS